MGSPPRQACWVGDTVGRGAIDRNGDEAVGILIIWGMMGITTREMSQPTGGEATGADSFKRDLGGGRSRRGGFSVCEGKQLRLPYDTRDRERWGSRSPPCSRTDAESTRNSRTLDS